MSANVPNSGRFSSLLKLFCGHAVNKCCCAAADRPVRDPADERPEAQPLAAHEDNLAPSTWQPLQACDVGAQQAPPQTDTSDHCGEQDKSLHSQSWNDELTQRLDTAMQNMQPNLSVKSSIGKTQPDRRHTAVT